MKQSQRIAKNAAFGLLAAGVGGGLQFFILVLIARFLGVVDFGIYSYLLAFASIVQFLSDFGLSNILVREMARRPEEVAYLLGSARALFGTLFLVALVLTTGMILLLPVSEFLKFAIGIMSLGYLVRLHVAPYSSVLRATENMEFNSLAFILHKVVMLIFLLICMQVKWHLIGVVLTEFFSNIVLWIYYSAVVRIGFLIGSRLHYDWILWKSLLQESVQIGSGLVLRQTAWQMDVFLLGLMVDPLSLGLFSCPFRFLMGISLFSGLLTQPLFPMFARLAHDNLAEFSLNYQRTMKWFCLVSLPVSLLAFAWPEQFIHLLFGARFLPSSYALKLLSFSVFPLFLSVMFPFLFSALGRQMEFVKIMLIALVMKIGLQVLLVPRFGYLCECLIIDLVELILFLVLVFQLARTGIHIHLWKNILKPVLVAAFSFLGLSFLSLPTLWEQGLGLTVTGVLYLCLIWTFQIVEASELTMIISGLNFLNVYLKRMKNAFS